MLFHSNNHSIQIRLSLKLIVQLLINKLFIPLLLCVLFHFFFIVMRNDIVTGLCIILGVSTLSHANCVTCWSFLHIFHILSCSFFFCSFLIDSQSRDKSLFVIFIKRSFIFVNRSFEYEFLEIYSFLWIKLKLFSVFCFNGWSFLFLFKCFIKFCSFVLYSWRFLWSGFLILWIRLYFTFNIFIVNDTGKLIFPFFKFYSWSLNIIIWCFW